MPQCRKRVVRPLVVSLMIFGCGHTPTAVTLATPHPHFVAPETRSIQPVDPEAKIADAREWTVLGDALCKIAGAIEHGEGASFGLARESFFDAKDGRLREAATPIFVRVAATFSRLPRGGRLVVTSTLEDDAANLPLATKNALASQRAAALEDALVRVGVDRARLTSHVTTRAWEGDYDGPATLDPAEGRVAFAVER